MNTLARVIYQLTVLCLIACLIIGPFLVALATGSHWALALGLLSWPVAIGLSNHLN